MDWWWRRQLADKGIEALIHDQNRIVSRAQLQAAGWTESHIRRSLRNRRWQTVHPGVYATHTGPIGYDDNLLAALLHAGPEAAWSHYTAAEQLGLLKPDGNRPVYVTIPERRRIKPRPNVIIHRDEYWADRLAPVVPPRRSAADAVLDIVGITRPVDQAAAVIAEACQSGRVSPADILTALARRPRLRHRRSLRPILADVAAGSHSLLELRYLRDVERRHGLPTGLRQRAVDNEFTDVFYRGFELVVELDGRLHLAPRQRWRDLDRDNRATLRAEATLRYGWVDVTGRPCQAAVQVLQVLRRTQPALAAEPCSPSCPVR
ncbi:type IV toxin-antitoxin system AbiEi family antitoxin domain-containing protein [Kribbella sp. NPDC023972]|uniref:type IV toxin-antitoxin system AbiEi family antitoxin domain-containing protein n=1 Tax=Kribbella sp. NPDC023972 TaxID=3154795 RepID=UPI0033EA5344